MSETPTIEQLQEALRDALNEWEHNAQYKGEYLREKHGDAEQIAGYRCLLPEPIQPPTGGEK